MENQKNIPIFNFIFTSVKEKNNEIKEDILLGNIQFSPNNIYSLNKNVFHSENHKLFLNNLSNQLDLIKIKEEKEYLNNKIEITDNKIRYLKNNIYNRQSKNSIISKNISSASNLNTLPLFTDNTKKYIANNFLEIKPLIERKKEFKNKIKNRVSESDLEQNAKNFIKRINESKKLTLSVIKQKQQKDYLKLKKQIEIIEKKRKMREEFEIQRKNDQKKENNKKQSKNISNIKFPTKKYHYFNMNKQKGLLKNFTEELSDFNSPIYYNNNNLIINQFNQIVNTNKNNLNQYTQKRVNTQANLSKVKILGDIQYNNNNGSGAHNNSLINISNKNNLYYFNAIK